MDLVISGNNCHILCWTKRWSVSNYSLTLETWMSKSDLQDLRNSVVPGASSELYSILGRKYFFDQTWQANNTIVLIPQDTTYGNLSMMRPEKVVFVKSIVDNPCEGQMGRDGYLNVKLEFNPSGNQNL